LAPEDLIMQVLRGITQERASLERQSQLIEDVKEIRESNGWTAGGVNGHCSVRPMWTGVWQGSSLSATL
jgi:hypothetical protein